MDRIQTLAQVRDEITRLQAVETALLNLLGPRRGRPPKAKPTIGEYLMKKAAPNGKRGRGRPRKVPNAKNG
jgi:hypothetical protein